MAVYNKEQGEKNRALMLVVSQSLFISSFVLLHMLIFALAAAGLERPRSFAGWLKCLRGQGFRDPCSRLKELNGPSFLCPFYLIL